MPSFIQVENLSKKYLIRHKQAPQHTTLREAVTDGSRRALQKLRSPFNGTTSGNEKTNLEEFWALKDISFDLQAGDRLGVIGRNGAGKSTLLKILSRITDPTSGKVILNGRVASLLEVGTGFHPELTGRENIFLNAAILGMKKSDIVARFDEIVAFAEVEKFLDTPVKRYSSGMRVRLAFAVAAHIEPEILIVDEVLAVGDARFQRKCLGKMSEVGAEGRTVLFVSHNMTALKSLCDKAIWLDSGRMVDAGDTERIVPEYLHKGIDINTSTVWADPATAPGNNEIRLSSFKVSAPKPDTTGNITISTPMDLVIEFYNLTEGAVINFSVVLYNDQDICIFNTGSDARSYPAGKIRGTCHIPGDFLNDSTYRVRLLIVKDRSIPLIDIENVATFEVHDVVREGAWYGKWIGAVRPKLEWETTIIEQDHAKYTNQ